MYSIVAVRDGEMVERVPGFATMKEAEKEVHRFNSMPAYWYQPDGKFYRRPQWQVLRQVHAATDPDRK